MTQASTQYICVTNVYAQKDIRYMYATMRLYYDELTTPQPSISPVNVGTLPHTLPPAATAR